MVLATAHPSSPSSRRTLTPGRLHGVLLAVLLTAGAALPASVAGQEQAEAAGPAADAALTGTVTDAADGQPLGGALVAVPSLGVGTETDADGRYALDGLPARELTIEVRVGGRTVGSRTVGLRPSAVNRVDLAARTGAVEVPGVEATVRDPIPRGKMAGFYLRREDGQGHFLTRAEIRESNATQMSGVFRRVPGVRLLRHPRRPGVFHLRMTRAQPTFTGDGAECRPKYFVDGRPFAMGEDQDVNQAFDPDDLAGLEVYRGVSEIPARFNGPDARCGVVVLWTRDPVTDGWSSGGR